METLRKKGFTLIELLVVIAIIAILAGLLLPAVNGVRKKGYESRARTEVKAIETALKAYLNEYNRYPAGTGNNNDIVYANSGSGENATIIGALRGTNSVSNPRLIPFLEVAKKSTDSKGNMIDPWNNMYRIAIDANFDNIVKTGVANIGDIAGRNIVVWSIGSDGKTNSYIKSWD